jgi:hypothetical protein
MLRISQCLDSRLTDGSKAVSPTHRPRSTPQKRYFCVSQKRYFCVSGTHFCWRLSEPQGLVRRKGLGKFIDLIVSPTRDLPACGIMPQLLYYGVPPGYIRILCFLYATFIERKNLIKITTASVV